MYPFLTNNTFLHFLWLLKTHFIWKCPFLKSHLGVKRPSRAFMAEKNVDGVQQHEREKEEANKGERKFIEAWNAKDIHWDEFFFE